MWTLTLIPLLAAVCAGLLAWHHATRLDRQQIEPWPSRTDDHRGGWPLVLGALVAAVAATTVLQLAVLSSLGPR